MSFLRLDLLKDSDHSLSLSQLFLFFFRKMINFLACHTATAIIFCCTFGTLNKKQVTGAVFTIGMCIGRLATLVAMGNDFPCNGFTQPLVENKIFTVEFIFQSHLPSPYWHNG